jgi:hypothetical protein
MSLGLAVRITANEPEPVATILSSAPDTLACGFKWTGPDHQPCRRPPRLDLFDLHPDQRGERVRH